MNKKADQVRCPRCRGWISRATLRGLGFVYIASPKPNERLQSGRPPKPIVRFSEPCKCEWPRILIEPDEIIHCVDCDGYVSAEKLRLFIDKIDAQKEPNNADEEAM